MVHQIISAHQAQTKGVLTKEGNSFLNISEFYCDTIQGEGVNIGHPAAFLRLKGCTMNCVYCDSKEVWRQGSPYTYMEILSLMEFADLPRKLYEGQHLIFTGGSPLIQQEKILGFLTMFKERYDFLPYIEIENECVLVPIQPLIPYVNCWNNSPKLVGSEVPASIRYEADLIEYMSALDNSWFKFVISDKDEWKEIDEFYLKPKLIKKDQIILMPEGCTRAQLEITRPIAIELATTHGVRFTDRLHITLWDKMVGV